MTAVLAAFSLQGKIEQYGAYAGVAAVFGLGILSLLYFAQAREVKRLREWAGRAPERAAELEARVTADAQRRVTPAPAPTPAPRPAAPMTPAAQQSAPPPGPGVAAPATAAAAAAGAPATAVAKPGTTAPQNGTGSGRRCRRRAPRSRGGQAAGRRGEEARRAPPRRPTTSPSPSARSPSPPSPRPSRRSRGEPPRRRHGGGQRPRGGPARRPRRARPLRCARRSPRRRLPPRTPAGTRPRPDADDGRSRGRIAAIVGGVVAAIAVVAVAGFLLFGGSGGDKPTPKPNTVAQPTGATTGNAGGSSTPKTPAKVDRKAVPLAVLNGTTVTGLARGAADKLTKKGYNEPNVVTNDTTNQARPTTQIYYEAKARAAALDVAKILGVPTVAGQGDGRQRAGARRPRRGRRLRRGRQGAVVPPPHDHPPGPPRADGLQPRGPLPGPSARAARRHRARAGRRAGPGGRRGGDRLAVVQPAAPRARDGGRGGRADRPAARSRTRASSRPTRATGRTARSPRCAPRTPRASRASSAPTRRFAIRAASRSPSSPRASRRGSPTCAHSRGAPGARGLPPRRHPPRAGRRPRG